MSKAKRQAFRQSLQDPNVDESVIRANNNEMKSIMNTMADHRLEGVLAVRKILTPEQFQKFSKLRGQRKGKQAGRANRA